MFINELGMKEVTEKEAIELGIDLSMVSICKKLRGLAKLDRLRLDETEHRSKLNTHLFDYIRYCGMEPLEWIKDYLSNLQPYMLERRKNQEKEKSFICVIDNLYRVSVYIKVDNIFGEEAIISFHEDNIRGIAKTNIKVNKRELVPVFADTYGSINLENGNVSVKIFVQRGMKVLPLSIIGFKCKDVFIVYEEEITREILEYCNLYIRDLYTSNLNLDFDSVDVFTMLQQLSFTSYGIDTLSSISLLIDSLVVQKDSISRQVADFALFTFAQSLKITNEHKEELLNLLQKRYKISSIKDINIILSRVSDALGCGQFNKEEYLKDYLDILPYASVAACKTKEDCDALLKRLGLKIP